MQRLSKAPGFFLSRARCKKYGMMPLAHLVEPSPYQPIEIPEATTFPLQPRRHRKPGSKGRKMRRKKVKKPSTEMQDTVIKLAPISKTNEATHLPGRSSAGEETTAIQTTLDPGPIKMEGEILTARHPVVLTVEEVFSNETWQGERPISGPSAGHSQVSKPRPGETSRRPNVLSWGHLNVGGFMKQQVKY